MNEIKLNNNSTIESTVSTLPKESHTRSLLKGISWRFFGTISTLLIAYFVTGNLSTALQIGGVEVFTKILLFYFHERLWQIAPKGTVRHVVDEVLDLNGDAIEVPLKKESHLRSILKGISWRIVGTIDTLVITFFLTGSTDMAMLLGGTDTIVKLVMYYFHERAWQTFPVGTFRKI